MDFAFYRYPLYAYGYTYKTGTTLVSSLSIGTGISTSNQVNTTFDYTYNSLGYITNVKKNGTTIASYSYDSLGQLISESNAATGEIYIYTYDKAGNITKKDIYVGDIGNLTDTITYTYGNTAWKDRLTNYDGTTITYDSIGNPTKWRNSSSLAWDGRTLTSQTLTNGNSITYKYNSDGIRTQKRVYDSSAGSYITHDYVLDGTTIVKEAITSGTTTTTLEYYYDESGIVSVRYNGTLYHYIKNLQGDVIGIVNSNNGALVVEYTYDAWGNILSVTGSLASTVGQINPFRYRGYYYDSETGLYYLNSRYYDAEVGRFINADGIVGANGGLQGYNMFAYCNNNPVMGYDPTGEYDANSRLLSRVGVKDAIGISLILGIGGAIVLSSSDILIEPIEELINYIRGIFKKAKEKEKEKAELEPPNVSYPGDDPKKAPDGTEWRGSGEEGSGQGNYHNPETGESWHPDLNHPGSIGPHWDYRDPTGKWWRVGPSNNITPK